MGLSYQANRESGSSAAGAEWTGEEGGSSWEVEKEAPLLGEPRGRRRWGK